MAKKAESGQVNIIIPEYPFGIKECKIKKDNIYRVHDEVLEQNIAICNARVDTLEEVKDILEKSEKKLDDIYHKFYFFVLFGRIASKDSLYNKTLLSLDREKNQIKKVHEDLKRKYKEYKKTPKKVDLSSVFEDAEYFVNYQRTLENQLDKVQKKYYSKMKMPTYSACDGKTYLEVFALSQSVNEMLDSFNSISEAGEYYIYNSGELIVNTVNSLVTSISNMGDSSMKNEFPYEYFLKETFVLVLEYREWISLFSKFKQVMKRVLRFEAFDNLKFKTYYEELEKRYIVVLMYNEINGVK